MIISFFHVPSEKSIKFKAFITAYTESFNPEWATETVYGRADPIYLYKNTQRRISLTFKAVAASEGEAYENLGKIQQFIQFLYPTYTTVQNAQTISQSPLVRLKVMNLLQNMANQSSGEDTLGMRYGGMNNPKDLYVVYSSLGSQPDKGLLGWLGSVTINHNLADDSAGVFMKGPGTADSTGRPQAVPNTILPKFIEVTCDFNPIHEHPLGWEIEGETLSFAEKLFPYGVQLTDPSQPQSALGGAGVPYTIYPNLKAEEQAQDADPPPDQEDGSAGAVDTAAEANAQAASTNILTSASDAAGTDTREVTSTPVLGNEVDWDVVEDLATMTSEAEAGD